MGQEISYTLLDYEKEQDIPPLVELLERYERVSVTAPYKQAVFSRIDDCSKAAENLKAVNAIKLENNKVVGTNTDVLAVGDIFMEKFFEEQMSALLLGDGAMSKVAQSVLKEKEIPFKILSRKLDNLQLLEQEISEAKRAPLVINACSRDFILKFKSNKRLKIWDFNYSLPSNSNFCQKNHHFYFDGEELLFRQARYALSFWNL